MRGMLTTKLRSFDKFVILVEFMFDKKKNAISEQMPQSNVASPVAAAGVATVMS